MACLLRGADGSFTSMTFLAGKYKDSQRDGQGVLMVRMHIIHHTQSLVGDSSATSQPAVTEITHHSLCPALHVLWHAVYSVCETFALQYVDNMSFAFRDVVHKNVQWAEGGYSLHSITAWLISALFRICIVVVQVKVKFREKHLIIMFGMTWRISAFSSCVSCGTIIWQLCEGNIYLLHTYTCFFKAAN